MIRCLRIASSFLWMTVVLIASQDNAYLQSFIQTQKSLSKFPDGVRFGVKEIAPLKSRPTDTYFIALPLTEAGESYYPGQAVLDAIWATGSWSLRESSIAGAIFSSWCKDGEGGSNLMVDGGAHIGFFSHMALFYGCDVLAIEPFHESRNFIQFTAKLNGYEDRLTLANAVVSNMYRESVGFDGWMVERDDVKSETEMNPASIRIDDLVAEIYGSEKEVVYVKLDVEGHELEAYEGLGKLFQNQRTKPQHVFIEMNTFDGRIKHLNHVEQALQYARLLDNLVNEGYMIFPMEGDWGENHEFLDPILGVDGIAQEIIRSQKIGCVSELALCLTEIIAIRNDKVESFAQTAVPLYLLEKEVLRRKMIEEAEFILGKGAGESGERNVVSEDVTAILEEGSDEGNKVPWATIFVRRPDAPTEDGYQIRYPFDLSKTTNYFRRSVCPRMNATEIECKSVLHQVNDFIRLHSSRQIGFVEY